MEIKHESNIFYIGDISDPLAKLDYRIENSNMMIDYVFVSPQLRGQGIAAQLIEEAVKFSKENKYEITPICSYARKYLN